MINDKESAVLYFSSFFESLKQELLDQLGNKNNDELSYQKLAFKESIFSLPCPVSVVKIDVDINKYRIAESENYYLIKYELSKYGNFQINFYGEINIDQIDLNIKFANDFDLNEYIIEDLKELRLVTYGDTDWPWYWFLSEKKINNIRKYSREFLFFFEFNFKDKIKSLFGKEINYNSKYKLEPDKILDIANLLSVDETVKTLFNLKNNDKSILEKLQKDISCIQLTPNIPKEVIKVFNAAKKLYIFGFFDYYFFTISQHYTFLAVESALRNKYVYIFGKPKNFIKLNCVIEKLVEKKVIRKAEHYYYKLAKKLRNSLSHLTHPTVLMPNPAILERAAFMINQIYEDNKYNL